MSAPFSPIMTVAALVLPDTTVGMVEASMMRRPEKTAHAQPLVRDRPGLWGGENIIVSEDSKARDAWDKIDIIGKLLGAILIPCALAGTGFFINLALQDRASREKEFEIAVTVLESPNVKESAVRNWALGTFQKTVNAPQSVITQLKTSPLPSNSRKAGALAYVGSCVNGRRFACYYDQNGQGADCREQLC